MSNIETTYVHGDERVIDFDDALARAWANIRRAAKDGTDINKRRADGSARRYTTLAAVDEAIRDALTAEGFTYPQPPSTRTDERGVWIVIHTQIRRKGVAFVPEPFALLAQGGIMKGGEGFKPATAQDQGSALTYARRYALTSIFGVCPDDDDDGHKASQQPEPDLLWKAYETARTKVTQHLHVTGQQAHQRLLAAAVVKDDPNMPDTDVHRLIAAAERLLAEPAETPRERAAVKGEQTTDPHAVATEAFAAAGKAYLERRAADYLDAECKSPDQGLMRSFRERAVAIACEAIGTKTWPGDAATIEQLTRAAAALLAIPVPTKASPKTTPRDEWNAAREAFIDAREADYRREEGGDPDADLLAQWSAEALAISAQAAEVGKWPARPSTEQWLDAAMALRAAGGAR